MAKADFVTLWSIGNWNGNPEEFNWTSGPTNAPGSAYVKDNDYYLAGTYPTPIGTVAVSEPWTNFESGFSDWSPTRRIHFNLTPAQATSTARIRLNFHHCWGSWELPGGGYNEGYGIHAFRVRWRTGANLATSFVLGTRTVRDYGSFVLEVNSGSFTPVAGENVLEITRLAPPDSSTDGGISPDALTLEIDPTALLNADGDGLPRWWEQDHGLNDNLASDAALDLDGDGLTNVQEFTRGTLPRDADSDDDGLKDGAETGTGTFVSITNTGTDPLKSDTDGDTVNDGDELVASPMANPNLADTDGDGTGDAWELRTGYNAASGASTPPFFNSAIGIKFVSDVHPLNTLPPQAVTGFFPQRNWNCTWALTSWRNQNGGNGDIVSPVADSLVNSAGVVVPVTLAWTSSGGAWASSNGSTSLGKLLDGYLNATSSTQASVTLSGIQYITYDVVVYAGSVYDGAHARIRLNNNATTDRYFLSATTRPQQSFVEPIVSDATQTWRGNTLHFRNVSGSSLNVRMISDSGHEGGIHAIQIVNMSTDSDGDGMPDAWEFAHQLMVSVNDASLDADGDNLSNGAEYTRRTDPRLRDTDGDGLEDLVETGTGIFLSLTDTGTNPMLKDTDGDGLSDSAELAVKPVMTLPSVSDSDGDGRSDGEEVAQGTNPRGSDTMTPRMPVIQAIGTNSFDWNVDNVQVVWDHTRGQVDEGNDWRAGDLFSISIQNSEDNSGNDAVYMALTRRGGRMTWYFHSNPNGAFSSPSNDGEGIWDSDWNSPPTTDLGPLLGFSNHGAVDISDRLQFRVQGSCPTGVQTNWNVTFTVRNMDTNQTVVTSTFNGCFAHNRVQDGNAIWDDGRDPPNEDRFRLWTHDGVQVFFEPTALEQMPAFSAWADNDEDGMPNAWETTYSLNISSSADASLDGDADGLTNLREYLAGTNPNDADSDDDLAKDGAEVQAGSNPMLASSKPPMHHGAPSGVVGEDLNGNGMSDAWEQWAGSFNLNSLLDVDGDGMSNGDEAVAGTNPFDSKSRLWVDTQRTGNDLTLRWPLLRYKQHRVWQSTDMSSWSQVAGSPVTVGEEYRQTLTGVITSGPPKFYEARVLDIDTDNDGVSDWTETNVLGSSTTNASSTRADVPVDANQDGTTEGTMRGDYATLLEQFQGAAGSGGFPGAGSSAAGISRPQASRFLMQGTFGPTLEDIQRVQQLGYEAWITEQVGKPATHHAGYIKGIYADMLGERQKLDYSYGGDEPDLFLFGNNMKTAFARAVIQGEDQLRQRVAFALNQILVTSRRDANIENRCLGIADYYDIFVRHAFGNYRDILAEVTMHPVMGRYLSHVGNQKADPSINRYPDENYAREVMQLFTIGLWQLNPDGSRQLDGFGQPIPTYTNADITQLARVMTGFWFGNHNWFGGGWTEQDYATPMSLHAEYHDFGTKALLGGLVLPARPMTDENALRDVTDSLDFLFNHPNTGVFIGKQLIQFLVTDNPSPAYVQRVSAVFANNGSGVRGDLGAVVRAILLDVEARDPRYTEGASFGRLKEPVIRAMALARAFGMKQVPDLLWWDWNDFYNDSRQEPTYAPSVFNFYRPDYKAPGLLTQSNLTAPVFQITDSYSAISYPNRLWDMLENGFRLWDTYNFPVDLSREKDLAANPERLVDHLNLIFCAGKMRPSSRTFILNALSQIPVAQTTARARVAAYLALVTPEGAVMR
ncbi:DUF1800 family protein [Brevifollis gellanilyticus]|uniref:DUF1800 family protein n=1 Tax=Brevifollis gellanilyticus TaxID=748831 RepID=UPI001478E22D|nr:DUF1800 family protein [Brevifollis gellanilyticus]